MSNYICWFPGTDLFLQCSPHVLNGVQDFVKAIPKLQFWPGLASPLPLLMCIWDHCPAWTANCTQDPIFCWWVQVFLKIFFFKVLYHFSIFRAPDPLATKQFHSIIETPPYLTVGMVFSIFVSSDHRTFLLKGVINSKLQLSFMVLHLQQGFLSHIAACQPMTKVQGKLDCGHN